MVDNPKEKNNEDRDSQQIPSLHQYRPQSQLVGARRSNQSNTNSPFKRRNSISGCQPNYNFIIVNPAYDEHPNSVVNIFADGRKVSIINPKPKPSEDQSYKQI